MPLVPFGDLLGEAARGGYAVGYFEAWDSYSLEAVLAAVILAVLGGLIAGSFGGWRAARLRPAAALSKVA